MEGITINNNNGEPNNTECMVGAAAYYCLIHLICGEGRGRNYKHSKHNEFGYFHDGENWVVFDNRLGSLFVDVVKTEYEAERLLIDGEEFLTAC